MHIITFQPTKHKKQSNIINKEQSQLGERRLSVALNSIVELGMWCAADRFPRIHITADRMSENDSLQRIHASVVE